MLEDIARLDWRSKTAQPHIIVANFIASNLDHASNDSAGSTPSLFVPTKSLRLKIFAHSITAFNMSLDLEKQLCFVS